jgi:hypothetical protein
MRQLILIFLFSSQLLSAKQTISPWVPDSARKELMFLLDERKKLFDEYSASINKKTGFFGNQTKNDLRDSRLKLEAIVAQDNKIMSALNRTLDFRNFEKQNLKYDFSANEERIRNLKVMNDTLNNQVQRLQQQNKYYVGKVRSNRIYFALLIMLIGGMIYLFRRRLKSLKG